MISNAVLITGVGKRVGLHLARNFLARGDRVIGTYRAEYPSLNELRDKGADLYACDFYEPAQVQELIKTLRAKYSSLRAVIHNASDWMADSPEVSEADSIDRMMKIHVSTPYRINLALEDLLKSCSDGYADIIHIGDYVSSRGSKKHIAYAASKAAQDNLTLSFAAKLAPQIKVNSIAPALVLFNEEDDAAYRKKTLKKNLLQREAGLDEVQHSIDYLMDSQYVTGRVLPLDGGRHLAYN